MALKVMVKDRNRTLAEFTPIFCKDLEVIAKKGLFEDFMNAILWRERNLLKFTLETGLIREFLNNARGHYYGIGICDFTGKLNTIRWELAAASKAEWAGSRSGVLKHLRRAREILDELITRVENPLQPDPKQLRAEAEERIKQLEKAEVIQ
jgi:hypothetical protein